ncbi:hypothetical protein PpBr36_08765 [Pyricularia pennisetigena]|uniref:hypothetical protein n=1 Tax=Pyricularia pennisetigena TaxID=1578925 RepID=UPI0011520CB3|nr:hypothetical protein PpBr36_08765 [Pyricularia pennisetigena]TLS23899.1 hypothetical protein PpBr36_08765 [Pyricularia pennisetigena]
MAATTATYSGAMPSQPYPQMPASPTLTNPDMILPDYDRPPSMDLDSQDLDRSQSPLMMWKNAQGSTSSVDLTQQMYAGSNATLDAAFVSGGPMSPITPTTPIIYGNGTMLSDIGEVTEVESTPGKPWTSRPRGASSGADSVMDPVDDALRSSPTMGLDGVKKLVRRPNDRQRSGSMDSTSTITTQDRSNIFADFDDSVSVGDDSVFLGDDEESVADSYRPDEPAKAPVARPPQPGGRIAPAAAAAAAAAERRAANVGKETENIQESLSQRAELILANAKRRLTTMEGNLNRARNTLHSHSPSLSSLGSECSTPSPTRAFVVSPGHSRMGSENTFRIGLPVKVYPQRSASAMGAAGGYRQPLTTSKSVDNIRYSAPDGPRSDHKLSPGLRDANLAPLSENQGDAEGSVIGDAHRAAQPSRNFLSPTFGYPDEQRVITRSASVNQMRDLKDQVQDLKGKISSLRDQARMDSIRRRSFQSLRTPSPFTNARVDQWFDGTNGAKSGGTSAEAADDESTTERSLWTGEVEIPIVREDQNSDGTISAGTAEDSAIKIQVEDATEGLSADENFDTAEGDLQGDDDISDMVTEDGNYDDENPDYTSESGESSYHDTFQHPLSHEDREDAFDYEHFILHSALGTISQQRMARRERGSFSSEESVETQRGPVTDSEAVIAGGGGMGLRRSASHLSTGTSASKDSFDSFATADEGRASRAEGGRRTAEGNRSRTQTRTQHRDETAVVTTPTIAEESDTYSGFVTPVDEGEVGHESSNEGSNQRHNDYAMKYSPPVATVARRPASSAATHKANRPSVSSLDSTGTMRSFPLVSRKKATSLTSIPNTENLRNISNHLMNDAAAIYEQRAGSSFSGRSSPVKKSTALVEPNTPLALQQLLREDKFLVERLVASIGKCVLGLTENGRSSAESRMYRRRLDAARRILEGIDTV